MRKEELKVGMIFYVIKKCTCIIGQEFGLSDNEKKRFKKKITTIDEYGQITFNKGTGTYRALEDKDGNVIGFYLLGGYTSAEYKIVEIN